MGLVAQFQKGMANNLENSKGDVTAYSLNYTNGPLAIRYANSDRTEGGVWSSANQATVAASATNIVDADSRFFNNLSVNKKANILGVSYAIGPVTVAAAKLESEAATAVGGAMTKRTGNQMGVGYTTGAWTLGGSITKSEGSKLTNTQARYALSKRTNIIGQYAIADNGSAGTTNFAPFAFNTGVQPAQIVTGLAGATGVKTSGFGVGLTHAF
jgi:predicted porin